MDDEMIKLLIELVIAIVGVFAGLTLYIIKIKKANKQKNKSRIKGNDNIVIQENKNEEGK